MTLGLLLTSVTSLPTAGFAQQAVSPMLDLPMPGDRDACPVCGMFPARYPDWIATVLFKDGHADHFDGAKDLFKYLLDMPKYASGRKAEGIDRMGVTDYYATERIDARSALYVMGSDVLGPMGHELIPHPDRYDADEFMKDHQGKRAVTFEEVTMALLLGLDKGEFQLT
ncbi:nitrous oxide reductase accessory protein NosL [uncultured Cohaesibacter sp.]|uniref:nitrous oxide reductase accessory protein NosL n=1 Tax=uncultured Cohaesibacter sp. TaxID=1002546 RepID=UPI0029C6D234|nr:nitrous oxide reductase accessory protein NosL [uncultured Cohaesibacter sp.]